MRVVSNFDKVNGSMAKKIRDTSAAGQLLGYSIQHARMIVHLFECENNNDTVCIEAIADTSTHHSDGSVSVEETKSSLTSNPVSDRAEALWKTLYNWTQACNDKVLNIDSVNIFVLYVVQEFDIGPIANLINSATSKSKADGYFLDIRREMWGSKADGFPKKDSVAKGIKPYVDGVLGANSSIFKNIMKRISIVTGGVSQKTGLFEEINAKLKKYLIRDHKIPSVRRKLMGWVYETTLEQIGNKEPARISYASFLNRMEEIVNKTRETPLPSSGYMPKSAELQNEIASALYIKQLQIINKRERDFIRAASDFLKARANRTDWSYTGIIVSDSFDEFEEDLKMFWEQKTLEVEIENKGLESAVCGQLTHLKCMSHNALLQSAPVSRTFIRGSYYKLSDSLEPDISIGWHPDYTELLATDVSEGGEE